jgi:glutamate synthase domain-containing protein 1
LGKLSEACIIATSTVRKLETNFMCGIIGYLDKKNSIDAPVGRVLLAMLQALGCRGPDSAGVALFGPSEEGRLRISVPPEATFNDVAAVLRDLGIPISRHYPNGVFDARLAADVDPVALEKHVLRRLPGAEIICLGQRLNLFKQVGSPAELEATYRIGELRGTHGIGHTRMSTESRVDLSHSQPFWAHGVPDLATVHNGHITNYHKLRRRYEQKGYRFFTENDSEVIGVYLRDRMAAGLSLEDALRSSLDDFDGSFCYLAASGDRLAFVKDRFGFKPLMVAETEDFVAIATEEIALRQALGRGFPALEPAPGTMRVWTVTLSLQPARHS